AFTFLCLCFQVDLLRGCDGKVLERRLNRTPASAGRLCLQHSGEETAKGSRGGIHLVFAAACNLVFVRGTRFCLLRSSSKPDEADNPGETFRCAGYVFQRVGKIAATAIGGGFLLLQMANHSGYVQVDWKKVEKDVNKAKKHLKKKANKAAPEINTFIEEATDFIKRNIIVSSGFVGGFFLGLAS
uniref:FUN14 domain-containing protein 1 n=1 Tax=Oryzias latipes TaxID=8090 RepID=A0A3P9I4Z5_ORYLA